MKKRGRRTLATVDKQLEEERKWRPNATLPLKDARKDETVLTNYLERERTLQRARAQKSSKNKTFEIQTVSWNSILKLLYTQVQTLYISHCYFKVTKRVRYNITVETVVAG